MRASAVPLPVAPLGIHRLVQQVRSNPAADKRKWLALVRNAAPEAWRAVSGILTHVAPRALAKTDRYLDERVPEQELPACSGRSLTSARTPSCAGSPRKRSSAPTVAASASATAAPAPGRSSAPSAVRNARLFACLAQHLRLRRLHIDR